MPIVRADIEAALASHDTAALRIVLEAADVSPRQAKTSRELAARIADALWWHYSSPLGYLADQTTLEDVVQHAARKLGVTRSVDGSADGWTQLRSLTHAMFQSLPDKGVSLMDLDEVSRAKVQPSWVPTLGFGMGSGGSVGTAWMSGKALTFLRGPIGRLLPFIPPLAPYYKAIVAGLGTVRFVAWPLSIGFAVLSVNSALGANERKLVPLLLGVGALGPKPVEEADVIHAFEEGPASVAQGALDDVVANVQSAAREVVDHVEDTVESVKETLAAAVSEDEMEDEPEVY